jgi:hypothetical protein
VTGRTWKIAAIAAVLFAWLPTLAYTQDGLDSTWRNAPLYRDLDKALALHARGIPILRLDLSGKRMKEVPASLGQFTLLRELNLDKNRLRSLPDTLAACRHLVEFSAEGNRIEGWPEVVMSWGELELLALGDNYIDSISLDIDALIRLRKISLWANIIGHFPASLSNLKSLERLDLLHNDMTHEEQEMLRSWLPGVSLNLSPPCRCAFDEY